jgi:hypothetical protein
MKYGVNTFIWSETFDPSHFGLLPGIKEAGFDGVEVLLLQRFNGILLTLPIRQACEVGNSKSTMPN